MVALSWALMLLAACSSTAGQREGTTARGETRRAYTSLPMEETEAEEEAVAEEPGAIVEVPEPPCELPAEAPEASAQTRVFRRWLVDQAVGRRVTVEDVLPICGDRAGSMVLELLLSGPAGGLQSLGYALAAYYPDSSWRARDHQRLDGEGYPLRIHVEVLVPAGVSPRPRCSWDPEISCDEGASGP